ncbi:MAG: 30S ribosomal protein S16 [Chloroflexi bacterium]|nr:30S ribosomal protein S16 [Chloroflexota bacterium]
MVRIRLRRIGLRGQPTYRVVAADKESPRDGRFLEILGVYNPRTEPATIHLKEDRIFHWMKNGAQPSESVTQIFKAAGLLDRFERFKKGESVEKLLAESVQAESKRAAPAKTRSH